MINTGFHLEASVSPSSVGAGQFFTLTVKVTNDAGSVIQDINSWVNVEVKNASSGLAGRGTLLSAQFQLLQGQRSVSDYYTFAEPVILVVRDDAGNAPALTGVLDVHSGIPAVIVFASDPTWLGGNKHATLSAQLTDAYGNGISAQAMAFQLLSGTGTLTPTDIQTDAGGVARADFLSPRTPEHDTFRASSDGITADLDVETALVDPNAPGGYVTNYPNPFRPPSEPTTIAWKLADDASVTLRIFSQAGGLVIEKTFAKGAAGGLAGLNQWIWDGKNGAGSLIASGGYLLLIEAQGTGETLHVIRRKLAAVR